MKVPPYMQPGSKGPAVTLLHTFLFGAGFGNGIVFDQEYGDVTVVGVKKLQKTLGIDKDGNFGPATREAVRASFGFDFDAACQAVPGKTTFIQKEYTEAVFEAS